MKRDKDRPNQCLIGPCRFDWVQVFEPKLNKIKEPPVLEYGVVILLPKEDTEITVRAKEEIQQVKDMIKEIATDKFGKELPRGLNTPLKDGDKEGDNGEPGLYPGYWYMRVSAKDEYPPKVIDGARTPIGANAGWGSGDWGFVKVAFFAYDVKVNKGVSAGLRALQFTKHDSKLGGGGEVSVDDFDEHEMEANSQVDPEDPFA